jgi:hypothetical protein
MGLIKTAAKTAVAVKTAHLVHDRIQRRQQTQWSPPEAEYGHAAPPPQAGAAAPPDPAPAAPPAAPASAPDRLSMLERLVSLRSAGMLTEAEFELEKARILQS